MRNTDNKKASKAGGATSGYQACRLLSPAVYLWLLTCFFLLLNLPGQAQELYKAPKGVETRWASFENPKAEKGRGGYENRQAKGHPAEDFLPGETKVLMDEKGAGTIQRIWLTISNRSPEVLRSVRIEMYWDGSKKPAVSAPLGDFFGIGLGKRIPFENALFSDPEGRSFNCNIPMPYRKAARVVLVNESSESVSLFYDINFQRAKSHNKDAMYFHAYWSRTLKTGLGEDFMILPQVKGKGRYLGMNMDIIANEVYGESWWGEGEVKVYLDGDNELATLVGTGTEDYIGTAWGQGAFVHRFQGCPIADTEAGQWAFYRYHIPDPVYFYKDCKVTIQVMGGDVLQKVREHAQKGAPLIPVTVATGKGLVKLLEQSPVPQLTDENFPEGWTNFYRQDDVSATAYFYLEYPSSGLAPLQEKAVRVAGLK